MQIIRINVKTFRFYFIHQDNIDASYCHCRNAEEVGGKACQRGHLNVIESQVFPETSLIYWHRPWFGLKFIDANVCIDVNNNAEGFEDSMANQCNFKKCYKNILFHINKQTF